MSTFSERLKILRLKKELSQQGLADELGVSKSSISMYERGQREPDFETLEAIADYFNVDMNYLIGYSDNPVDWEHTDEDHWKEDAQKHYYINDETRAIAQEVFESPELRTLFKVARDIPPERLKAHIEFMKSLKAQEKGDTDEGC